MDLAIAKQGIQGGGPTGYMGSWTLTTSSGGRRRSGGRASAAGPSTGGSGSRMWRAMWLILNSKEYTSQPSSLRRPRDLTPAGVTLHVILSGDVGAHTAPRAHLDALGVRPHAP